MNVERSTASRRPNKTPARLEDRVYYLVQFVDDGILAIVNEKDLKTRDSDGLKKAKYGDTYYLCTVMYESDDKEDVMKRKNALEKLKTPNVVKKTTVHKKKENTQKKNRSKARKKNEEKEQAIYHSDGDAEREMTRNKEDAAKKKAENDKKKAEKEQARAEKQKQKAEKDKERVALKERDNNILEQMNSMARTLNNKNTFELSDDDLDFSDDEGFNSFDSSNVVVDCCAILSSSPISKLTPTSTTRNTNHPIHPQSQPVPVSTFGGKRPKQHHPSTAAHQQQRPVFGGKRPRQQEPAQQQRSTTGGKRPKQQLQTVVTQDQQQYGGSRSMNTFNPSCEDCEDLIEIIKIKNEEIAQLKAQVSGCCESIPRPGKVPQTVAEHFKMVELSSGRGVYLLQDHINIAKSKSSATSAACFLLSCFYKNHELIGRNLTGANQKESVDSDIVASILDFAVRQGGKESAIRQALRNKISAITTRAK